MKKEQKTYDLYQPKTDKPFVEKNLVELNKTIQPGFVMSAGQKKTMNAVQFFVQSYAAKYYSTQEEFHAAYADRIMQLHIPRSHFMSLIAFNSRNQQHLRGILNELTDIEVSYDNQLDGDEAEFEFRRLIPRAGAKNGYVYFDIPVDTRRALVSPHVEATIDVLKVAENLSGKYAISLYQFLHGEFERMTGRICEIEIEDNNLRNGLNVPYRLVDKKVQWSYPTVGEFNSKVLKKAIAEINDAEFEFKIKAEHRKMGSGEVIWKFILTETKFAKYAIIANSFATEITEIVKELKGYGVKNWERVITEIESQKDLLYFQYCINEVNKAVRTRNPNAPKIKNKAGYFMKSLAENRASFEEHFRELQAEREKERKLAREVEQANVDAQKRTRFEEQKRELRRVIFNGRPAEVQEEIRRKFIEATKGSLLRSHWSAIQELGLEEAMESSNYLKGVWNQYLDDELEITDEKVEKSIENMPIKGIYL